jgi:hypothetical protein
MKKLLLLLLIAPVLGYGQVLTDILYISGYAIQGHNKDGSGRPSFNYTFLDGTTIFENASLSERVTKHIVPEKKLWKIVSYQPEIGLSETGVRSERSYVTYNEDFSIIFSEDNPDFRKTPTTNVNFFVHKYNTNNAYFLKPGTEFWLAGTRSYLLVIYEYTLDSNSLSYNEPETIKNNSNTPVLFPNPTSSLLALNSDKEYDIEVYDLLGNKLMALTGNNINMEHLSTATYIVKATDKSNNEELTYKVVKN